MQKLDMTLSIQDVKQIRSKYCEVLTTKLLKIQHNSRTDSLTE